MKIWFRPKTAVDNSADVLLSSGSERTTVLGPSGASISVSTSIQEVRAIRADYVRFIDRKNRAGSYQFTASRIFTSLAEAGRFVLTHGMTCPTSGTLIFEWSDDVDDAKVVLLGCVVRQIGEMKQTGLHVATTYNVAFSNAKEVLFAYLQAEIDTFYFGAARSRLINCGGAAIANTEWEDDQHFNAASFTFPSASVSGNGDVPEAVYLSGRGNPTYNVPLPAGTYTVKLHFCEPSDVAVGERVFHVQIDGEIKLANYDVFAEVGARTAVVKTFAGIAHETGDLVVNLVRVKQSSILSGIEIIPESGEEE